MHTRNPRWERPGYVFKLKWPAGNGLHRARHMSAFCALMLNPPQLDFAGAPSFRGEDGVKRTRQLPSARQLTNGYTHQCRLLPALSLVPQSLKTWPHRGQKYRSSFIEAGHQLTGAFVLSMHTQARHRQRGRCTVVLDLISSRRSLWLRRGVDVHRPAPRHGGHRRQNVSRRKSTPRPKKSPPVPWPVRITRIVGRGRIIRAAGCMRVVGPLATAARRALGRESARTRWDWSWLNDRSRARLHRRHRAWRRARDAADLS
jgi:hypothetical protein